jgi:hypothetical protein
MTSSSLHTPSELVAAESTAVAVATARFPNAFREAYYQTRVQPILNRLTTDEMDQLHRGCGFSHGIGWAVLSQTLGILSGQDKSREMGSRSATPLYTPKVNYGGWVRIFRSKAAALPKAAIPSMVEEALASLQLEGGEERLRGLYGIPARQPLSRDRVRAALEASDLFEAPWMAAIWRPEHGWAIHGVATRFLDGKIGTNSPDVSDLFRRAFADQVPPPDYDEERMGFTAPGSNGSRLTLYRPGPALGVEPIIHVVEMALSNGYRLDLVHRAIEQPIDSWEGGIAGLGKTPLMGVQILLPTGSVLVAFQVVGTGVRIEGLDKREVDVFQAATGVDPTKQLGLPEVEALVVQGIPVWGRIPSFHALAEQKA